MAKEEKLSTAALGRRLTLSTRLVLGAAIIAFVVVITASIVSYIELRKMVFIVAETTLSSQAKTLSNDLEYRLSELANNVRLLAKNSLISNALVDDRGRDVYLKGFLAGFQEVEGFNVKLTMIDFEGVPIAGNGVPTANLAPGAWISEIVEDEKGKAIIVYEGEHAYFIAAEPIIYTNTGTAEGVLVYQVQISEWLRMDRTKRILRENTLVAGLTLETSKADDTTIIARYGTEPEKAPTARVEFLLPKSALGQSIELELKAKPEFIEHPLNQLLQTTGFSGLFLLIFAAGLSVFQVRTQISKLIRLRLETELLTRQGSKNVLFTVEGNDEISDLANSFNGLVKDLHGAYQELEDRSFEKLQKSEKRFSSLVQSQSDLICRFTTDGTITFVNDAYSAFMGEKYSNLIDRSIYQDIPKDEINGVKLMLAQLTSNQPNSTNENSMINSNGEEKIIEWINHGLFDDHNVLTEVQSVGRDVTQQKLNEQQLIASQQQLQSSMDEIVDAKKRIEKEAEKQISLLEELAISRDAAEAANEKLVIAHNEANTANKAKSAFLASMSHELRTPMNAVLGFAQMLQFNPKAPLSLNQNEHVENILEGGNHLLSLVNQVLDLASIEADQLNLSLEDIEVNQAVSDCVNLVYPPGESRSIKIINKVSGGKSALLFTDQLRFKQVLINIIGNALKFNKDGGTVTLEAEETDYGYLRISVTDTGIGIAKKDQSSVFNLFHRVDADPLIAREGTGIGLNVAKLLVTKMGGRIGVESEEGVGSTFWVDLPLASNDDVLIWTDAIKVGVDTIDKDHQVLISILNRLTRRSVDEADLDDIINELIEYTQYHFRREESIMKVCGYPAIEGHQEHHRSLIDDLNEHAHSWRNERTSDALHLLRKFLKDWLFNHIMKEDTKITSSAKGKNYEIREKLDALGLNTEPASHKDKS